MTVEGELNKLEGNIAIGLVFTTTATTSSPFVLAKKSRLEFLKNKS